MRVMLHTNAPWAGSGYGVQAKLVAPRLAARGHETAISAFYGLQGGLLKWGGVPVYPAGNANYGIDVGLAHARHFGADVTVCLMDCWVLPPMTAEFNQAGMPIVMWSPVDQEPMPIEVQEALRPASRFWCYSKHGTEEAGRLGLGDQTSYVPLAVDDRMFKPTDREAARAITGLPQDKFIVGMIAANKCPYARKAWPQALKAFAEFAAANPDAHLYLHTETTRAHGGWDIDRIVAGLDIGNRVSVVDRYLFHLGLDDSHMAAVFNSIDCLLSPSLGEGFGVPIIEAQACGKPVIVGDWTSMSELFRAGYMIPKSRAREHQTFQGGYWHIPDQDAIVEGLQLIYDGPYVGERDPQALHAAIAGEYGADVVVDTHIIPALMKLKPNVISFPASVPEPEVEHIGPQDQPPVVSIIIPTVKGREESLARCEMSYRRLTPVPYELIIVRDRDNCGQAWEDGVAVAKGTYLHITADDIEAQQGWWESAIDCMDERQALPSAWLDLPWGGTDGDVGADGTSAAMTPLPFLLREDWPGVPPIGYWSDYAISARLMADGHRIVWCHGFRFTHHRVQDAARRHHESRFQADRMVFEQDRATYRGRVKS